VGQGGYQERSSACLLGSRCSHKKRILGHVEVRPGKLISKAKQRQGHRCEHMRCAECAYIRVFMDDRVGYGFGLKSP
jgi:hypothetical protein